MSDTFSKICQAICEWARETKLAEHGKVKVSFIIEKQANKDGIHVYKISPWQPINEVTFNGIPIICSVNETQK